MSKIYTAEHLVIITSNYENSAREWRTYLNERWNELVRKNSRILVLAGVHGTNLGKVGDNDPGLFQDNVKQIQILKRKWAQDIDEKNVEVSIVDVATYQDSNEMDNQKLIKSIKDHNPTILVLSFCWSKISDLNDVLRSAGIYTLLIMSEERAQITEGRYVILDDRQKEIVETVSENNTKNVFLWGGSGTGKTLLLMQLAGIKRSWYRRIGMDYNILITAYLAEDNTSTLMREFRDKYLSELKDDPNVHFLGLWELCKALNVETDASHPQLLINYLMYKLSIENQNKHTLLVMDEVISSSSKNEIQGNDDSNWSMLSTTTLNLDFLLALNPQGLEGGHYEIQPPQSVTTISRQLVQKHRNCFEIGRFITYINYHTGKTVLSPKSDMLYQQPMPEELPTGQVPIWIEKSEEVNDINVLDMIKQRHIDPTRKVTLLYDFDRVPGVDELKTWCENNTWRCMADTMFTGCEDSIIVLLDASIRNENISRGRNCLIVITTRG